MGSNSKHNLLRHTVSDSCLLCKNIINYNQCLEDRKASSSNSIQPRVMSLKERLGSSKSKKIYHRLPDAARTILEIMKNDDILLRIITRYGGCTLNIPVKWPPVGKTSIYRGHPLRRVLTPKQMLQIVSHYGGTALYIPNCNKFLLELRNEAIIKAFLLSTRKGLSSGKVVQRLARRYRLSDRRIWDILKKVPENVDINKS